MTLQQKLLDLRTWQAQPERTPLPPELLPDEEDLDDLAWREQVAQRYTALVFKVLRDEIEALHKIIGEYQHEQAGE